MTEGLIFSTRSGSASAAYAQLATTQPMARIVDRARLAKALEAIMWRSFSSSGMLGLALQPHAQLAAQVIREQMNRHAQPVRAQVQQPARERGVRAVAARMLGPQRNAEQRDHQPAADHPAVELANPLGH